MAELKVRCLTTWLGPDGELRCARGFRRYVATNGSYMAQNPLESYSQEIPKYPHMPPKSQEWAPKVMTMKNAKIPTQIFSVGRHSTLCAVAIFILGSPAALSQPYDCQPQLLEQHIRWCLDIEGNRKQRGIKKMRAGARDGKIRPLDRGYRACQKRNKAAREAYFACPPGLRIEITRSLMGLPAYGPEPAPLPK